MTNAVDRRLRTRAEQIADELRIADGTPLSELACGDGWAGVRDCARCGATHGGSSCMAAARAAHKKMPAPSPDRPTALGEHLELADRVESSRRRRLEH